jgi:hypothetical protein
MQWRIALSWVSGYFIFQLFTPVLFAYQGAVVAGQMGMSLSIATALNTLALAWINTKAPMFGLLIARGEFAALDRLFFRSLRQATIVAVLLAWGAWVSFSLMRYSIGHTRLESVSLRVPLHCSGSQRGCLCFGGLSTGPQEGAVSVGIHLDWSANWIVDLFLRPRLWRHRHNDGIPRCHCVRRPWRRHVGLYL